MAQLKAAGVLSSAACCSSGAARPPLLVAGHRGRGMNALASQLSGDVRENTLRSFNDAATCPGVHYVEFDVQVTKDGCPVIFHDVFIYTTGQDDGHISGKRVTDLRLDEFLSYGPQKKDNGKAGKLLLRKLKEDGRTVRWGVRADDALCTLQEAFQGVDRRVGFNVELKFDDDAAAYTEEELAGTLRAVLQVVFDHADARPVLFSSFHPDAALLTRKLQDKHPVYFLTKGGTEVFADARRNSLEEAVRLSVAGGMQAAPVGGGGGQGGAAVPAHLRPAQQRAGGGVRAAPDGRRRRDRRPGAGDRRGRLCLHIGVGRE